MSTLGTKPFDAGSRSRSPEELPQDLNMPSLGGMSSLAQAYNNMGFNPLQDVQAYGLNTAPTSSSPSHSQAPRSTNPSGVDMLSAPQQAGLCSTFNTPNELYTPQSADFDPTLSYQTLAVAALNGHQSAAMPDYGSAAFSDMNQYSAPLLDEALLEAQFGSALNLDPGALGMQGEYLGSVPTRDMSGTASGFPSGSADQTSNYSSPIVVRRPITPVQLSPPLTTSPSGWPQDTMTSQRPQLPSPTVTVEYFGRSESPRRSRADGGPHTAKQERKRSNAHLSPYPQDFLSADDNADSCGGAVWNHQTNVSTPTTLRNENGVWISNDSSATSGVGPDARDTLLDAMVPTLDELESQRQLNERNADVEDWLAHSEVGSEGGGNSDGTGKRGRPRARSANAAISRAAGLGAGPIGDTLVVGPGVLINEPSEMDEEDDSYQEDSDQEPTSPVATIMAITNGEDAKYDTGSLSHHQNWGDSELDTDARLLDKRSQPPTANAAIMRFKERAKEIDAASLAATIGSGRRRSESDLGSVVAAAGISKPLALTVDDGRPTERKGTLFGSLRDSIMPSRSASSRLKRKASHAAAQAPQTDETNAAPNNETQPVLSPPKRIGSFGRSKTPKLEITISTATNESKSPISGIVTHAKDMIRRSRSRSELARSPKSAPGLAALWEQHGGPPVAMLASPSSSHAARPAHRHDMDDDSGDDDGVTSEGVVMDLSVRSDMSIIPTYDGFKYHARQLNPRIKDYLLERLTQEQLKRYKRLVEYKSKHAQFVTSGSCPSKTFCFALGGESKQLPPRIGNKDPDTALVSFQIMGPGMTEDDLETDADGGQVIAAHFPTGVPLPPVKRLPAEFECPLCFKVKKFFKPSDWTKHVHEDVQPFTCTFPNCSDPKSFKRKADWVRHESERHRQLERWTCNIGECTHTCYRKDNFVQHLVREHKVPEPKVRTGRNVGSRSPITPLEASQVHWPGLAVAYGGDSNEDVWALVDRCRRDATKNPRDEHCRFCGNVCSSWKKLTVHLAKHMEQISMPVLGLIEQRRIGAQQMPNLPNATPHAALQSMPPSATLSVNELPRGMLCAEPSEMSTEASPIAFNDVASQVMHTYPPPNLSTLMAQAQSQQAPIPAPFVGQTYPPPAMMSRSRSTSFSGGLMPNSSGTSYTSALQAQHLTPQMNPQQQFLSPQQGYGMPGMLGSQNAFLTGAVTSQGYGYLPQEEDAQGMQRQMGIQG